MRHLRCETQAGIAEAVGMPKQSVSDKIAQISENAQMTGHGLFTNFTPKIYPLWNFGKSTNAVKHFGNIPPEILDNLLYYYTKPFDVVFDPFGGGGMTIDICQKRQRRYYVSDLTPIPARVTEIRQWDITSGLPDDLPVPDFVFLDPPYWKQAEGKYSDKETDLSNIELDKFVDSIAQITKLLKRKWRNHPNAKLAIIMGIWKKDGRFIDLPSMCNTAIGKYLTFVNRIQVPYSTQVHGGAFVKMAKENKEMLYLNRDLTVWGM